MFLYILISCGTPATKGQQSNRSSIKGILEYQIEAHEDQLLIDVRKMEGLKKVLDAIVKQNRVDEFLKNRIKFILSTPGYRSYNFELITAAMVLDHPSFEKIFKKAIMLDYKSIQTDITLIKVLFSNLLANLELTSSWQPKKLLKNLEFAVRELQLSAEENLFVRQDILICIIKSGRIDLLKELFTIPSLKPDLNNENFIKNGNALHEAALRITFDSLYDEKLENMKNIIVFLLQQGAQHDSPKHRENFIHFMFYPQMQNDEDLLNRIKNGISAAELEEFKETLEELDIKSNEITKVFYE